MSDYYNIIDSAEKRAREEGLLQGRLMGLAEGREEGREEGRMEAMLQNAQKMKESGIDAETIMQITGLDMNTICNM